MKIKKYFKKLFYPAKLKGKLKKKELEISELVKQIKFYENKFQRFYEFEADILEARKSNYYLDNLNPDKLSVLLAEASAVWNNKSFKKILDFLAKEQAREAILRSADSQINTFHRAAVNNIFLILDEFEKLNNMFLESKQKADDFDKHEII